MADTWKLEDCHYDPNVMLSVEYDWAGTCQLHGHEFSEIVVILEGNGEHFFVDGQKYPLEKGDVFVVHGDTVHGYRNNGSFMLVNIVFKPEHNLLPLEYISRIPGYHALFRLNSRHNATKPFNPIRLNADELNQVKGYIDVLSCELSERKLGYEAQVQCMFLQIVTFISRRFDDLSDETSKSILKITEVLDAIEEKYSESLSTVELASLSHMSVNHFIRVFKAATGTTPLEYLTRYRIRKAVELLSDPRVNITEVAYRVGYNDGCQFSRQFRKIIGCSPRDYRRRIFTKVK